MSRSPVDRIVNALLYEGYILYPYRATAVKNQMRFTFGVVYPKAYADAQSGNDSSTMQTECLVSGSGGTSLTIRVRFLRMVDRTVSEMTDSDMTFRPAASIRVDGKIYEPWQEAVECSVDLSLASVDSLMAGRLCHEFEFPWGRDEEILRDSQQRIAGAIRRIREAIRGRVEVHAEPVAVGVFRVSVRIVNTTAMPTDSATDRDLALARSLISAHTVLGVADGEFVSLLEPPEDLREAASQCRNEGTWPVLVGEQGIRDTVLSSPIILYDYPAIAPESPGELFDSLEIDEILTLRVLTMTEQEKEEMRRVDDRARMILERAESMDPQQFARLHGTLRGVGGLA